jgi:hypothetical protein
VESVENFYIIYNYFLKKSRALRVSVISVP